MRDLAKKKISEFSQSIDRARGAFDAEIYKLAEQARAEILPYFKKHNYDYKAGNGDWIISKPSAVKAAYYRPEDHVSNDDLPANIRALLMLEVAHADHLGFYVRDIKRGQW